MDWVRSQVGDNDASPMDLPDFNITVAYEKDNGGPSHTVRLMGVQITSLDESASQNDKSMEVSMELLMSKKIVRE